MIKCEGGRVKYDGTAVELTADVITICEGLLRTLDDDNSITKEANNILIKNIVYAFTKSALNKGFSTTFSAEEMIRCEETYNEVYEND